MSSSGAVSASESDGPTLPLSIGASASGSQTSALPSVADSSTVTPTSTQSGGAVTSSTPTSSTPSQPTSTTPLTTSQIPTSSPSSTPPHTTSPTTSSSSVPPSDTTQPPITSSSQQGIETTITSAYTTYINGSQIVTQTSFPSTIPQISNSAASTQRTAVIAGSAAGATALLILILTLAFCARRKQFKQLDFLQAISLKRKQEQSRATMLDGEDDLDLTRSPRRYTDYDTPWDLRESRYGSDRALISGRATPGRWSETGSVFREDLWPPPSANEATRLMDSFANKDDVDLSRIVDDVMGPSPAAAHFSDRSVSSMYRDSVVGSEGFTHSRTISNASNMALLEAAGLTGPTASTAPVRSSPLAQSGTKPSPGSTEN